jgi:hypothetical protein
MNRLRSTRIGMSDHLAKLGINLTGGPGADAEDLAEATRQRAASFSSWRRYLAPKTRRQALAASKWPHSALVVTICPVAAAGYRRRHGAVMAGPFAAGLDQTRIGRRCP